jgi:deoxyribodipyrimidine photolyase-related protein
MKAYWILGDQLLPDHPALAAADKNDVFLFIESAARGSHLRYHQHKLVLLYSAMRHYAEALKKNNRHVSYHHLEDGGKDFLSALQQFIQKEHPSSIVVMEPNEWEMQHLLPKLSKKLGVPIEVIPNQQFLVSRSDFKQWAGNKKTVLMASHYQFQRKRLNILLDSEGKPEGGAWSYDAENRASASDFNKSKKSPLPLPTPKPDALTREVIKQVAQHWPHHPGKATDFWLPVTRVESLQWLDHFIQHNLADFGPFEDTMISGQETLYHSVLSPLLNIGLLTPRECVDAALKAYHSGKVPLASVEGFVRQIIGWREFINGIYWLKMPEYRDLNFLKAERPLPSWIYTGETDLNCLHHCITQVKETGYNHHIQRLMVLGNFFILGGYEPKAVLRWYMEMYVDAYDWVMQPNVLGMVLYADGGYFATKPYVAGSGYISRMSNYCTGCKYKPEIKTGPEACPFNYLYWNFFDQHGSSFKTNPRIGMMLRTWEKKPAEEKETIRRSADGFLRSTSAKSFFE